jgi:all-trans-retinol dehydrogenase (NAD+)
MAAAVDIFGRLPSSLKPIASVVLSLGVCYAINSLLSRRAVAGKRPGSSWRWNEEGEGEGEGNKEIVVVTGGSGGIGGELVREFVRRGVTVVSLDIKPPSDDDDDDVDENDVIGSEKEKEKEKKKKKSHFYQVDLRSRTAIKEAATHIRTTIGSPTVLINNAGLASGLPILQASESSIRDIFDVNILSHFWLVQEFLPEMVERDHGHVVSVASVAAYVTLAGNVEYSCAKAGVMAFHEGLGQELRHRYGAKSVLTRL